MKKDLISIVIPCYNEEESLPVFYEEITKVSKEMKNVIFEYLFINDGSKDKTLEILKDISKKDKRLDLFHFQEILVKNQGCMLVCQMLLEIMLQ